MSTVEDNGLRLGNTSPILSYFCIYNPSLGQSEENTEDQILYYTSKKPTASNVQMKQIGLAQALVNFTHTFSPSQPTQNVHSQKNRLTFLEPESGFWVLMCVELGVLRDKIKDGKGKEKLVTEYLDSQLHDSALEAILKLGYEQFKLLNGTFSSILYDSSQTVNQQRKTKLVNLLEEFFSDWIWKWDFDRLYNICFTAIFRGVPFAKPVVALDDRVTWLKKQWNIHHVLAFDLKAESLVFQTPNVNTQDVSTLRHFVLKKAERHTNEEKRKTDLELAYSMMKTSESAIQEKVSGFKQFTASLTSSPLLNYFSSGSKSTASSTTTASAESIPVASDTLSSASSTSVLSNLNGMYLAGLVESTATSTTGEERPISKPELIRVYLSTPYQSEEAKSDSVEYYIIIYKHKNSIAWCLLLPTSSENQLSEVSFYQDLRTYINEWNDTIKINPENQKKASEHRYPYFYYNNVNLDMKSTMVDPRSTKKYPKDKKSPTITINNDMLLQLLEIKNDFERFPRTNDICTRSTSNCWITGIRIYDISQKIKQNDDSVTKMFTKIVSKTLEDYADIYLVATKKDTSLADIEDALAKMSKNLLETGQLEP